MYKIVPIDLYQFVSREHDKDKYYNHVFMRTLDLISVS